MFLPRGVEHSFTVMSEEARLLVVLAPSGLEGLYWKLNVSETGTAPHIERLVTVAARYGVEITGPGPLCEHRDGE